MTIVRKNPAIRVKKNPAKLWFEKIMALLAAINFILVIFNLTYVPLRDFWFDGQVTLGNLKFGYVELQGIKVDFINENFSKFITQYDQFKGIIPNRETEQYLEKVDQLKQVILNNEINSPEVTTILGDLRRQSLEMIQTNPFAEANKIGTLERIKNRMREHLPNQARSAKQSFWQFWSPNYLQNQAKAQLELIFFDQQIRPLIASNYYRYIGENGRYIDNFGLIDFPFGLIFGLEFLARTWYISRSRTGISWLDAMLWRWYDVLFLLPFWRWLRIIPVTIRLNQAQLIDLHTVQRQISQGVVASIAEDVTEIVVIRIINQIQTSIRQGEITKLLSQHQNNPYIDINNTNETAEIVKILSQLLVYQVLPKIRPEAEALLQYSIEKVLKQTPAYQGIRFLPGSDRTIVNLTQQLVQQTYQIFSDAFQAILEEDEKFNQLLESLLTNLTQSFSSEIKAKQSIVKIELLLIDLLEEIKINYVERLSHEDIEAILEQTRSIRQIAHHHQQ
ncbi:hypothetical protein Sta7437_3698 [Stanieria cyanosphaera PCC 7437]|uniref:Uncharacterized protein n=1 Tax=Stanieria cyanosphaera (strain ATCC 29371 / PCC 7437) TaxID=111780 RepID=K9XYT8_STAC7|nr:hypothetical protein [Stanieria cyanosphaera]AFZ37194.1 hypothetical protein Sta7437_3698 [Stanieria cyanosphaera PCC 7437]